MYIAMNVIFCPLLNYQLHYPAWLLIPTIIFFIAPMRNDIITYALKLKFSVFIEYIFFTFLLYGSMLPISIIASFKSLFGTKAVFTVTRKSMDGKYRFIDALILNRLEIVFSIVVGVIALFLTKSILPVLLIVIPALSSIFLTLIANKQICPNQKKQLRI